MRRASSDEEVPPINAEDPPEGDIPEYDPFDFLKAKEDEDIEGIEIEEEEEPPKPARVLHLRLRSEEYYERQGTRYSQVPEAGKREPLIQTNAETKTANDQPQTQNGENDEDKWKCPICFDNLQQPVVTRCGHVFCWPCINEWLRRGQTVCPCCHGQVEKDHLIPIYGQGEEANLQAPPPPRPEWIEGTQRGFLGNPFGQTIHITRTTFRHLFRITPQGIIQFIAILFLLVAFFI